MKAQKLTLHESHDELATIYSKLEGDPRHLYLSLSIKFQLEAAFPYTRLKLYSYKPCNTTYFYGFKLNKITCHNLVMSTVGGDFDEKDFIDGFAELLCIEKILETHKRTLMFICYSNFTDAAEKYIKNSLKTYKTHTVSQFCTPFHMSQEQQDKLANYQLPQLPEGFYFDELNVEDESALVTSTWQYAEGDEVEQTKEKLRRFPSIAIRNASGQPVAFEMLDHCGSLNHQYVMPEYRRLGLGTLVELHLAQQCIKFGITPHKSVSEKLADVIVRATKSPFWTHTPYGDKQGYLCYFVISPSDDK